MFKTLGIVQARLGSTRLKGKVARRLGGKSLLEWVVRRVTDCQRLDAVIVATGDDPAGYVLAELVPADVPLFVGSEHDVLARFAAALEQYPAKSVVRVCADNPFVDPVLIDRLVRTADLHPECDYISYCSHGGRPAILSAVGVYAEWCSTEALLQAHSEATDPADREHVTRYMYSHPERFQVRLIPAPTQLDRDDVRLTVDLDEDWEHAQAIYEALGPEELDWQRIAELLDGQPDLRSRMAVLNRKYAKV
jgi:spore coat polysaccharide biosynthesis protein SpsF